MNYRVVALFTLYGTKAHVISHEVHLNPPMQMMELNETLHSQNSGSGRVCASRCYTDAITWQDVPHGVHSDPDLRPGYLH